MNYTLRDDRVLTMSEYNSCFAKMDIIEIRNIDQKTSTCTIDFYLWFRYKPKEQDPEFNPENIDFTNAENTPAEISCAKK